MILRSLGAAGASVAAGTFYASVIEPRWVELNRVGITIRSLPQALDGFTIAHLSDLHRHAPVSLRYIEKCLALGVSVEPDLMVITGDFVSKNANYMPPLGRSLNRITRSVPVYAVLGNHDYWTDVGVVRAELQSAGVQLLVNQSTVIEKEGERLTLVGLDDLWEGKTDIPGTIAAAPASVARVVLMHNPDAIEDVASYGVDLVLCGHTHGGQVALPFVGPLVVPSKFGRRFARGLYRVKETQMYVNKGVGLIRPAVRFMTRPEVAAIVLTRPKPAAEKQRSRSWRERLGQSAVPCPASPVSTTSACSAQAPRDTS